MRPDSPATETDPADVLDQLRDTRPESDPGPVTDRPAPLEADPADVADQERDVPPDEDY